MSHKSKRSKDPSGSSSASASALPPLSPPSRPLSSSSSSSQSDVNNDPRQRIYSKNIEAPSQLAVLMGSLAKQVMLRRPENLLQFIQDYFVSLYSRYSSDYPPQSDSSSSSDAFQLESFLQAHARELESSLDSLSNPQKLDFSVTFTEPIGLRDLLVPFSREFIRYSPVEYFRFASEYWTAKAAGDRELEEYLLNLAREYEPQWRAFSEKQLEEQRKLELEREKLKEKERLTTIEEANAKKSKGRVMITKPGKAGS